MIHAFHPEAASEYAEHVAFYKSLSAELGVRFHKAVEVVIANICETPALYRSEIQLSTRRARVHGFPYNVIFREVDGDIQILAVAHHRRRPLYWLGRL